jgi:ABC-2 type transport system permease protein
MTAAKTLSTTGRVLSQLRHDHRTLALIFVVPSVLMTILKYVYQGEAAVFDTIAPMLLGIFPMIMMFLITSIVTLRERSSGTLSRLMTMPMAKPDFIFGYAVAFCVLAFVQAVITSGVVLGLLGVTVLAGTIPTLIFAVLSAFLGTAMGLFTSAFARSEFQAVQFLPAFVFPQLLVCGLFVARPAMSRPLQWFADIMPLTYSVDGMKQLTSHTSWTTVLTRDVIVVACFALLFLALASATIRRQETS